MDLCWVHGLRAGVGCGADGVVHADEDEDKVAVDRTSASPRGHLVQRFCPDSGGSTGPAHSPSKSFSTRSSDVAR